MRSWSDFWKSEKRDFFQIMEMSTAVFAQRFDARFGTDKNNSLLDFGCGPGFFIQSEIPRRNNVTGVDINAFFVDECKRKFPDTRVFLIPSSLTEMENVLQQNLGGDRFDFIVFLSVCQYFESREYLEGVIKIMRRYLSPSGQMVFADVVNAKTSSLRDASALLWHCVKKLRLFDLLVFLRYLRFSVYQKITARDGLQLFTESDFKEISRLHALTCERVEGLTLHPTRANYVLRAS